MVILSSMPQVLLWIERGRDWNGAYVSAFVDEPFYASYVNALIDGRPRRNDPFGATDDSPKKPLPESLYSIQFVPAYAIAFPARACGIPVSVAFVLLTPLAALLASLSVFWLITSVTYDHRLAAAGTLFVLCLGGFFGSYGIFQTPVDIAFPVLPFLRRYEPAVAFPFYFVFGALVWRALISNNRRRSFMCASLAGLTLSTLIYSYFYLWSASAVWLGCIGLLWFCFRPHERRRTAMALGVILAITAIALLPYAYLILRRSSATDDQQILVATRMPELFHVHEILAALLLVALALGCFRGLISRTDPRFLVTGSLALLPFVIFNQQIVTGRTLQAFHFEIYSVNYSVAIAIVIAAQLLWSRIPKRVVVWTATLSVIWGMIAVGLPARAIGVDLATANDKRIPVLLRLRELSSQDGTLADLRTKGLASTLVFSSSVPLVTLLPSWTSQGTLLDTTGGDCAGVTRNDRKRFFYMHLYYSMVDPNAMRQALQGPLPIPPEELQTVRNVVFGHARLYPGLTSRFTPVEANEIEFEVLQYQMYVNSFSRSEVLRRPISYAVIPVQGNFDFTNLDRWYERDAGERIGDYVLYRLRLKP